MNRTSWPLFLAAGALVGACAGNAEQGTLAPSTQVDVLGATGGRSATGGSSGGTAGTPQVGGAATGGSIATGGAFTMAGGASNLLGSGGGTPTSCPGYAPTPGSSCTAGTRCTYPDSGGNCTNSRATRARCSDSRWLVDVPIGCAQDVSKSDCALDATWTFTASGDSAGVRGIPNGETLTLWHDSAGQYYVSQAETSKFSWFDYSSQGCIVQASYHYETIIPPPDGSNCGLVSTDCELELAFSNGAGNGTLTCTGHPNTCVGVYGGHAVLQVKAVRSAGTH